MKRKVNGKPISPEGFSKKRRSLHQPAGLMRERIPQDVGLRAENDATDGHHRSAQRRWGSFDFSCEGFSVRARQQESNFRRNPIENEQNEDTDWKTEHHRSQPCMGILFVMVRHRQIVASVWNQASYNERGQGNPFLTSGMNRKDCNWVGESERHDFAKPTKPRLTESPWLRM